MDFSKRIFFILLFFGITKTYSQFTVDAQLRPRFEFRHGYKTLFPNDTDPAAFVSQRTRLNFGYKTEKLNFYVSAQDVRVWGDVPQLNVADENGFSLHQAWAEVSLVSDLNLKIGRQEIVYDDQRFLRNYFWVIWYPLFFWLLAVATTVVAVPKALFTRKKRARWVSPDRGFRGEDV